jgi:hypothetical protein
LSAPTAITGTRPMVSVSLPLKAREMPAVTGEQPDDQALVLPTSQATEVTR